MKDSPVTKPDAEFVRAVSRFGFRPKDCQLPGERLQIHRAGEFANHCRNYSGVHEIEIGYHYNGSGPESFGGARQWPTVEATVAFNVGEEEKQKTFAVALAKLIDEFFANH
jgi:hypothetical protein